MMTQEELDKIVEQHQHWLHEDVDGWEEMREKNGQEPDNRNAGRRRCWRG